LRRQSYDLNAEGLFDVEYADVLGIPFGEVQQVCLSPIAYTTFPRIGALTVSTTDAVQRLPDGILTIGWEGYRIIQPVGPA
jgi:hypothetical protein